MKRSMQLLAIRLTLALAALAPTGCAGPVNSMSTTERQTSPETAVTAEIPVSSEHRTETEPPRLAGKVVETMDVGGYTYICLERGDGKRIWTALPTMKVTVGQELELLPGMKMANFTSKSLNRTFEVIIFSEGLIRTK